MTIDDLLKRWLGKEGGAERANYQMFLTELAQALGLDAPDPKGSGLGAYQFEAPVRSEAALGTKGTGRIDLYKRDHFILEAKQSQIKPGEALPADPPEAPPEPIHDLFGNPVGFAQREGKAPPRYDRLMADARLQAERYALALPGEHKAPPFLIVADIGRAFELYFDWSGNGRGYGFFPDQQNYRIKLEDLKSDAKLRGPDRTPAEILRAIWTDPQSIDPRVRAAEVTRQVAERLSRVAAFLEKTKRGERPGESDQMLALGIEQSSLFVMRLLFCMFAEDVDLLPRGRFTALLTEARDVALQDERQGREFWRAGLNELWSMMAQPGEPRPYWMLGRSLVRYFNGNLFTDRKVYDLPAEFLGELVVAAKKEWKNVEPAIFGTLLEQVLTAADRSRLGAHYTPRAYVERLVEATVMEVLEPEWREVREGAAEKFETGDTDKAVGAVRDFHERLAKIAILDPACGTGNFLYVAMEQLLRLEGEAIQLAAEFGATLEPAVHPNQFLGLELNPRAAVIAELVLWIGWLRHRLANHPDSIGQPVLPPLSNINGGAHGRFDAVLVRTSTGEPDTENPRRPEWPEADFIVGNPPFIGAKFIRERLSGAYAEALWKANPTVPKSADFVMQWWDRAADILTAPGSRLRRFGLVTTNSITQVFSRRVIEGWLSPPSKGGDQGVGASVSEPKHAPASSDPDAIEATGSPPTPGPSRGGRGGLSLVLAIPDHPWTRASRDAAAVRIAMTVAEAGARDGRLVEITSEAKLDTDEPELEARVTAGRINADLTVGTDVTALKPLKANEGLCSRGVQLMGSGFIVTPAKARELGLGQREGLEAHIRDYRHGNDLLKRPRGAMVIDLFSLTENEVMDRYPEVYQHVRKTVYDKTWNPKANKGKGAWEGREVNSRPSYKKFWWIFGEPRRELRPAVNGLDWYIATVETAKHRIFHRFDPDMVPDNKLVIVADDSWATFGVLSSKLHLAWAERNRGQLEDRPVYVKGICFDPFPFPDPTPEQRAAIAEIAEQLDSTRRAALAEDDRLTMTGLYNLVEAAREQFRPSPPMAGEGQPARSDGRERGPLSPTPLPQRGEGLSPDFERRIVRSRARIVAKLHDDLDGAVADAYGWGAEWRKAPLPPTEIVARLVALNAERAAEEAQGQVRWLRPDYQAARFGK